ncbi:MAG: type II toxin-antitoxin system RatA family toxin [Sphingomonadales bacterium]|nr:type II toxin-antitoxin system RatA family toxin [Sphingomonadales bacterium]
MPSHTDKRVLPFAKEDVFNIILDVAKYPEFLPWCLAARIYNKAENGFDADLVIGFKMFKERFTSRVTFEGSDTIHVEYIKGPMKHLTNHWQFKDTADGGVELDFHVDFAFKNPIFEKLVGHLFEEAVFKMIEAFEKRAVTILGNR